MKKILDYQSKKVVNIFDEVTLWSAPFGRLLLENMPMKRGMTVLDLGFGTGFPLIELSQRFGADSKIYGMDIWKNGIKRARKKIKIFKLKNIEIFEESAAKINLPDDSIDLVTSNLGINNFEEKEKVYAEIQRVLKPGGSLSLTTNPIGTFEELFVLFEKILIELNLQEEQEKLKNYLEHRGSKTSIINELEASGLKIKQQKSDSTSLRFVNAPAVLNHGLIRIGFRASWGNLINEKHRKVFYKKLVEKIDTEINEKGIFKMTIPMLYLEFEKL